MKKLQPGDLVRCKLSGFLRRADGSFASVIAVAVKGDSFLYVGRKENPVFSNYSMILHPECGVVFIETSILEVINGTGTAHHPGGAEGEAAQDLV